MAIRKIELKIVLLNKINTNVKETVHFFTVVNYENNFLKNKTIYNLDENQHKYLTFISILKALIFEILINSVI